MKAKILENWKFILAGLLLILIGFVFGRISTNTVTKTVFVKGETVTDTIYSEKLVPYKVEIPSDPKLIYRTDTLKVEGKGKVIIMKVDTAAIIAEYTKRNSYFNLLFDDQKGKLSVSSIVQYNKLQKLSYQFTPIYKETTIVKNRTITPFITLSYNTFGYYGGGGGLFYKNIGFNAKYLTNQKENGYEFGLNYKF